MTKEQAKEVLLDRKEIASPELANALEIAIECIDKQIPNKPDESYDGYADGCPVIDYSCPCCGREIDYTDHHCICGQTIDWSE